MTKGLYGEELGAGALAGAYLVREVRHRGTSAILYRAEHLTTGAPVALKVLRTELTYSPGVLRRFAQECELLSRLAHPHVARVLDSGELRDGRPFLVMEWLEGPDLAEELERRGPLGLDEVLALLQQVVGALEAAHSLGVVHRDVKVQNVVLRGPALPCPVALVDFGVAKLWAAGPSAALTSTGVALGTPVAMAPEQIRGGEVSPATDVYGLGVLAFQLLVGRPPFDARSRTELESMHLKDPPPAPSSWVRVPDAVDSVLQRAMAKRPSERHASAREFLAALEAAASGERSGERLGVCVLVRIRGGASRDDLELTDRLLARAGRHLSRYGLTCLVDGADFIWAAGVTPRDPDELVRWRAALSAGLDQLRHELSSDAEARGLTLELGAEEGPVVAEGHAEAGELRLSGPLVAVSRALKLKS